MNFCGWQRHALRWAVDSAGHTPRGHLAIDETPLTHTHTHTKLWFDWILIDFVFGVGSLTLTWELIYSRPKLRLMARINQLLGLKWNTHSLLWGNNILLKQSNVLLFFNSISQFIQRQLCTQTHTADVFCVAIFSFFFSFTDRRHDVFHQMKNLRGANNKTMATNRILVKNFPLIWTRTRTHRLGGLWTHSGDL